MFAVVDISPGNHDSSLWFTQPGILQKLRVMVYLADSLKTLRLGHSISDNVGKFFWRGGVGRPGYIVVFAIKESTSKENQKSQVKEFSAFLCMGKIQASGLTEKVPEIHSSAKHPGLSHAEVSSGAPVGWARGWLQGKHCFHPGFPWVCRPQVMACWLYQPFVYWYGKWCLSSTLTTGLLSHFHHRRWLVMWGTHPSQGSMQGTEAWGAFISKWVLRVAPKQNHVRRESYCWC